MAHLVSIKPALDGILNVLSLRTNQEVLRVDAKLVIARMTNNHPRGDYPTIGPLPCDTMCVMVFIAVTDQPVVAAKTLPLQTSAIGRDGRESVFKLLLKGIPSVDSPGG